MMSLPRLLSNLLLLLWLMRAAAVQPTIKNLVQSGETIVLKSPDFPNPYTMLPSRKIWQIRWALETPAHLQILFSDLRLHPNSRLELYDGDSPAFRLTPTVRLLVRYESGADYWRRIAFTADSGALTVVFTPLAEPNKHSNAFSWMDSQSEVRPATPNQPIPSNIDYEGFRIEIKLLYYASSAWLERPWSDCGWLQYTADSVSLLGTVWRHFDCVWVLRPPAGTKAWLRLRAHKLVKDSYRYDMEVHDGGTSAAARLAKLTSGTSAWQPEQVFISERPLYVRIRGNFSDSANHLVLQYHFFSIAAAAAAASPADCSKISPGFESCDKLHLCVLPVCYKLPELSACGPGLNCSLGPPGLRSCLLRLDSHDGQRGAGLRPRTLCRDGLRCVPLSVACPTKPSELLPPLTDWKRPLNPRPQASAAGVEDHPEDSESEDRDRADDRSSSSSSLNVLASLGGVCLAAVALIGLGFIALTMRSRRQRRRLQFQQRRHQRQPVDSQSASSLMRVFRLAGASSRRLQHSNNLTAARAEGEDECFAHHHQPPPPPTPPPAYSEVFGSRRPRTGQSPPKPTSAVVASSATAAAAASSATSGGGGCGEPSSQQAGHQRHRHSRHRQEPQVEPQSAARCSAAPSNPTEATQTAAHSEQPQDRPIQFEQPHTVRLPPLHGAC